MPEIAQPLRGCVVHGRGEPHAPFVTLVDLWANAVAAAPDAAAMEDQAGALTYRKVWNAGHAFAARLRGLGAAGRVVAILLPNGGDFHVAYLGALLARATPAPINPGYPPPQVRALLALSKAHTLVTPGPAAPDLAAPGLRLLPFDRAPLLAEAPPPAFDAPDLDDPAVLLFTGGTTGTSKAVLHTHRMIADATRAMEFMWPTKARGEVWLPVAPMSHIYGFHMGVTNPVWGMAWIVVPPRFQPDLIVRMLGEHRVTVFGGGPAPIYAALLSATNFATTDLSALAVCPSGGAPTPVEIIERWRRATGLQIHEGYGMTEMAPIAGTTAAHGQRDGSVGHPLPWNRVEVVDTATGTRVLPPNESGEVRIAGPYAMRGYLNDPEETARTLRDGWIYTGDIGHLDADGFLFITDRKKDMVLVNGFNVFPRIVEEALITHPAIRTVAVVGAPDDRTGERLVAFVVAEDGTAGDALREHVAARVAGYMAPAEFRFVEALPVTPAAKLDRIALRRMAAAPA